MKNLYLLIIFVCFGSNFVFSNPALQEEIYNIRKESCKRVAFRDSIKKIGMHLGVSISRGLKTKRKSVKSIMGEKAEHFVPEKKVVLIAILRGGIPMMQGFLEVFPNAEVGFLGMKRNEETLKSKIFYSAIPDLKNKTVIVIDPMLATGGTISNALRYLKERKGSDFYVACAFATSIGLQRVYCSDKSIRIYFGVIDPLLSDIGYIIPGCGDAGDRAYGEKRD